MCEEKNNKVNTGEVDIITLFLMTFFFFTTHEYIRIPFFR